MVGRGSADSLDGLEEAREEGRKEKGRAESAWKKEQGKKRGIVRRLPLKVYSDGAIRTFIHASATDFWKQIKNCSVSRTATSSDIGLRAHGHKEGRISVSGMHQL